jgi:hypothetical protein
LQGIPTVVLTRAEFASVTRNAVAGVGLAPDIAMAVFPLATFLVESDIGQVRRDADRFVDGLTRWRPPERLAPDARPARIAIEGADPETAFANFNALFLRRDWGDGLPLVPPTAARVEWILQGSDQPPATVIGKFLPRGGIVTVETLAVSLAMAGGRPEYLPVLKAAVEAILDPALEHDGWQATSSSCYPAVIVSGPVARQIRVNAGFGLLGPDPRHPAGASIGRAIRLLQQNVGGALPGTGTMAMYGGMRYTNAVFAEDEDGLPAGWAPFGTAHMGRAPGTNGVAVAVVSGATNIIRRGIGTETLEDEAIAGLRRIASYMTGQNANSFPAHATGVPGILILSRTIAAQMSSLGWTRAKIQQFLWEHARIPVAELEASGLVEWMARAGVAPPREDPWPITARPENIAIVVAGGSHPTHAYWLQTSIAPVLTGAPIALPSNWDALVARGHRDLGHGPDR